ncbi:hypothetical protein Emag_001341 [Eimeria magna]
MGRRNWRRGNRSWTLLIWLSLSLLASPKAHAIFGEHQAVGGKHPFTAGVLAKLGPQIGVVHRGSTPGGPPLPLLVYVSQTEMRDFAATWPSMFPHFQPISVDPLGDVRASWRRQATSEFVAALKKTPGLVLKDAQITTTPLRVKLVDEREIICLSREEAGPCFFLYQMSILELALKRVSDMIENAAANLISLHNVTRRGAQYYGQLLIHHEDGSLAQATNLELPLNALNPRLFSNDSHVAQLVQEATKSMKRRFFERLFKRDAASSKKGPLAVLLCVYPIPQGHGEEVNPVTIFQSLHKSREQAYSLLGTLMIRRALSEAVQQVSATSKAAAVLAGPTDLGAYAERSVNKVLNELEWVGLSTGLRLRADGSPVLPRRFSLPRLHAELTSRVHLLVDETTTVDEHSGFPLKVKKLRCTIESLEKQFKELCEKAGLPPSAKRQAFFDAVALKRWLAIYELLLEGPTQVLTTKDGEQLSAEQEAFLTQVRAEEAAQLQRLLERRVLLEAAELEALIAVAPSDEVKEDRLVSLEPWIQQLEEVVRVARLADAAKTPALDLILHYGERGRN